MSFTHNTTDNREPRTDNWIPNQQINKSRINKNNVFHP